MISHSSRQTINYSAPLTPNKGHLVYLSETAAMQAKERKWYSEYGSDDALKMLEDDKNSLMCTGLLLDTESDFANRLLSWQHEG